MQMLDAGGLPVVSDKIRSADEDNPKGYYELERVKDLETETDKTWLREYKGRAVKIISFLLTFLPSDINYKVVFSMRNIDEILASQKKMLERRGEDSPDTDDGKMKKNYFQHLLRVRHFLSNNANFQILYVDYHDILNKPRREAARINKFLGGGLDTGAMAAVVDRGLHRNKARENAETGPIQEVT